MAYADAVKRANSSTPYLQQCVSCDQSQSRWMPHVFTTGPSAPTCSICPQPTLLCLYSNQMHIVLLLSAHTNLNSSIFASLHSDRQYEPIISTFTRLSIYGSVSIVRRFDSPKIQLKLKLALTLTLTLTDKGGGVLTLTDTGDLRTIEPSDYRANTLSITYKFNAACTTGRQ